MAKCIRQAGFDDAETFLAHVKSDATGTAMMGLIDAMSTNLTSFFRENGHFKHLSDVFLPKVIANKRSGSAKVRAWSAGCSSGEEAYTLAMTLLEADGGGAMDIKLLATDISRPVLETAVRYTTPLLT